MEDIDDEIFDNSFQLYEDIKRKLGRGRISPQLLRAVCDEVRERLYNFWSDDIAEQVKENILKHARNGVERKI